MTRKGLKWLRIKKKNKQKKILKILNLSFEEWKNLDRPPISLRGQLASEDQERSTKGLQGLDSLASDTRASVASRWLQDVQQMAAVFERNKRLLGEGPLLATENLNGVLIGKRRL